MWKQDGGAVCLILALLACVLMQPMLCVGVQAADKMSEQTNMCLLCAYHHNCEDDVVYMCACVWDLIT